jgi:antitoxin component of RelBE/YafQ-DinJ toxin-antitoxin module
MTTTTTAKKTRTPKRTSVPAKTAKATIQVRVDAKTKDKAARFFKRHGLSTSDGVRRLIDKAITDKDSWLAHEMSSHLPNAESLKAIEEALVGDGEEITLADLRKQWNEA